MIIVEPF